MEYGRTNRGEARQGLRSRGFTLVELLLVIVILGILAAVATPLVAQYLGDASQAAAESNLEAAQKGVYIFHAQNGIWPTSLTPDLFQYNHTPTMPTGYSLQYDNLTGEVTLVTVP